MSPALPEPAPPPLERLDLASARHFVNLTNGIEALPLLQQLGLSYSCIVYDCGSRRRDGTPRALWYGLEFVRYCLTQLWKLPPCPALLRGRNVSRTFDGHIRSFKQSTVKRLKQPRRAADVTVTVVIVMAAVPAAVAVVAVY
eukprot:XP_001703366.1 predicted protein [Chlamydomonas reinhardtii]